MPAVVDPLVRELAERVIAEGRSKRAAAVLKIMLDKGTVSTDEINDLGYNHPPRAIGDVRDAGIPVVRIDTTSPRSGQRMGVYSLGAASDIQAGRIGGRSALPKAFKAALIQRYGSNDCITGAKLDERVLQIDHRVPYRIAGDVGLSDHDVEAYMLLDASSQRAKAWSCESCPNMLPSARLAQVCQKCFWASPESYEHVATQQMRRTDIVWQGPDVEVHDRLHDEATASGMTMAEWLIHLARVKSKEG